MAFKLKPGLKFHSGNDITAEDVEFSMERFVSLDLNPSFIMTQFGLSKDNVKDMVRVKDPLTVEVELDAAYAPSFFLNCLSYTSVVVDKKLVLENEKDGDMGHEWLKTNAAHVQPIVVANKVQGGVAEISKADFEASIERKIAFTVPYDIKAATNAAKLGQTFADANRTAKSGAAIRDVAKAVMGVGEGEVIDEKIKAKTSLLGKLDLKSMLNKKPKAGKAKEPAAA